MYVYIIGEEIVADYINEQEEKKSCLILLTYTKKDN